MMPLAAALAPHRTPDPDHPYHQLVTLPRAVWLPALVCAAGTAEQRLQHVAAWLEALLQGELPASCADFGEAEATSPLRQLVAELALHNGTRALPALAEQVVRTVLWHLDQLNDLQPDLSRAAAIEHMTDSFKQAWRIDHTGTQDDWQLLRELTAGVNLSWGELTGQLRSREWQTARRAADRLAQLPALAELLRQLGRSQDRSNAPPRRAPPPQSGPSRAPLQAVQTRIAGAPGELTGVRFAASLERMLPAEASLLRHPVGRRLWRARWAEARLLAYDSEAVLTDWRADPAARQQAASDHRTAQPLAQGPLVLCLDTSGSMRGAPENIAKAVVIAALRFAQAAGRRCRLIAFGGPGELLQQDLTDRGGLHAVMQLMGQAFDGGTDVQTPIERAIDSVHDAAWQNADVLIVSDGEFGCVPATLDRLDAARSELGLAVHGVLVGDRETMGMLEVCDHIHWIRDWRRHGDETDGRTRAETIQAQPVHSKSLTALYFPGALSARAARHGTAVGAAPSPAAGLSPPPTPK